jgi:hypothetical protein
MLPAVCETEGTLPCSQEPPLIPILNQMNRVPTYHPVSSRVTLILSPSTSGYSKRPLPFRFSNQKQVCNSNALHKCYVPLPSHSCRFAHHNVLWISGNFLIMQPFLSSCYNFNRGDFYIEFRFLSDEETWTYGYNLGLLSPAIQYQEWNS